MASVLSLDGKAKGKVELPPVFGTQYRPDVIQRTVVALQASLRQMHSTNPNAGLMTSGDYFGSRRNKFRQTINKGMSRLPRIKTGGGGLGRVIRLPSARGGRRSHGPTGDDFSRKVNRKEYKLALNSAIAATANRELVLLRGHMIGDRELPVVVEDKIAEIKKAKELSKALTSLGFEDEISSGKKVKLLIVVGEDKGLAKAAGSMSGVEVVTLDGLDVGLLAPGTHAGRLTIWGESAIKGMK
jgi:large subunit ribosomal protein L4e